MKYRSFPSGNALKLILYNFDSIVAMPIIAGQSYWINIDYPKVSKTFYSRTLLTCFQIINRRTSI